MAKQLSKPARADSSAGRGAAAVSGNTGTVAAAEPAEPTAVVDHAVADDTILDRAALLAVIKDMADDAKDQSADKNRKRRELGEEYRAK
jgi:hypothetical protein